MNRRLKRFLAIALAFVPWCYLVMAFAILIFCSQHSYQQIQNFYKQRWPEGFDPAVFFSDNFTAGQYAALRSNLTVIVTVLLLLASLLLYLQRRVVAFFDKFVEELVILLRFLIRSFRQLPRMHKTVLCFLLGALVFYRIHFYLTLELHTDEAFSYLFLAKQGFLHVNLNYVSTNNHLLLNVICSGLASVLPNAGPTLIMRLPSLVCDVLLWYGLFCLLNRFAGFRCAVFVVSAVCFCFVTSYHAVYGRGYKMMELFSVVSLASFWIYFFRADSKRYGYPFLVLSLIAGIYTNPLFVYQLVAIFFLAFLQMRSGKNLPFAMLARTAFIVVFFSFLLYLPLLMVNGVHGFLQNKFAPTKPWHNLITEFDFFERVINYNIALGRFGVFVVVGAIAGSFFYGRKRKSKPDAYSLGVRYFLCLFLAIAVVSVTKGVYPPERAISAFVTLGSLAVAYLLYQQLRLRLSFIALTSLLAVKIGVCVRPLYWPRYALDNLPEVRLPKIIQSDLAELAATGPRVWQIVQSDDFYPLYLRVYLLEHGRTDKVVLDTSNAVGDVLFLPQNHPTSFDLKGYRLWKEGRLTYTTQREPSMSIFVRQGE